MRKSKIYRRLLAAFLAAILVLAFGVGCSNTIDELPQTEAIPNVDEFAEAWSVHRDGILSRTLSDSIGLVGFEANNPSDLVEIEVWFHTPSAVALRLLDETDDTAFRLFSEQDYGEQAQAAHDVFWAQMTPLTRARTAAPFEIISEHYLLFNGVLLRTTMHMAEQIAALPEVFAVTPMEQLEPMPEPIIEEYDEILPLSSPDPLMRAARDLFNLDYIHNDLGITGTGVRVAIFMDDGINYRHPRFAPFLDPATGRLRGSASQFPINPYRNHGTLVAGSLIGIAPGIELWQIWGTSVLDIIEQAHRAEIDVISSSAGANLGRFSARHHAMNLAALDGMIFVQSAGNAGPGLFTAPENGLFISVAAGQGGSDLANVNNRDGIAPFSSRGPDQTLLHITPHITAPGQSVRTLNHSGSGYAFASGTSFASPVTAGVAALMLEVFPDAEPWEIQARMMNTARQLSVQAENSVFNIGAGFVQPHYALTSEAFATVQNDIFWPRPEGILYTATTATLSFGLVSDAVSHPLTVTIHEPGVGAWVPDIRYNGNPGAVQLELIESDTSSEVHTFTFQMTFPPGTAPGSYEGNVVFINESQQSHSGNPRQISIPFAAWFGNLAIEVDVDGELDFGTASVGQPPGTAHTVTVTNTGTVPAHLDVRITGEHAEQFTLPLEPGLSSQTLTKNLPTIPVGGSDTFYIGPRNSFAAGVFTATVEILGNGRVLESFDLRFERTAAYGIFLAEMLDWNEGDPVWGPIGAVQDFGNAPIGQAHTLGGGAHIVNEGASGSGPVTVTLTGDQADSFSLRHGMQPLPSPDRIITFPNIAPGDWMSFFVIQPVSEVEGLHRATVTVSTQGGFERSFEVRFTVGDIPDPTDPPDTFIAVAASMHTVALGEDGTVWTWGPNWWGKLGDGTSIDRHTPVQVQGGATGDAFLRNVTAIAAGHGYTVALRDDGTVWAWGLNHHGQLGDGTTWIDSHIPAHTPVQVTGLSNMTAISAGHHHTVALRDDGTVWAWGGNQFGQLGDGTTTDRHTPVQVTGLSNVTAISAGVNHTVALREDGTVWTWGSGLLGNGIQGDMENMPYSLTAIQVHGGATGDAFLSDVIAVAAGGSHTAALRDDGTVWAWGFNGGRLGDRTIIDHLTPVQVHGGRTGDAFLGNVTAIAAGQGSTVALREDGTVWTWGWNRDGRLGDGTSRCRGIPDRVHGGAADDAFLGNVAAIAMGNWHVVALREDGSILTWGNNNWGQLGNGSITPRYTPVQTVNDGCDCKWAWCEV